jgi:hypothetical protein
MPLTAGRATTPVAIMVGANGISCGVGVNGVRDPAPGPEHLRADDRGPHDRGEFSGNFLISAVMEGIKSAEESSGRVGFFRREIGVLWLICQPLDPGTTTGEFVGGICDLRTAMSAAPGHYDPYAPHSPRDSSGRGTRMRKIGCSRASSGTPVTSGWRPRRLAATSHKRHRGVCPRATDRPAYPPTIDYHGING